MKINLAIIGFGKHVQNKILPALDKLNLQPNLIISKNNIKTLGYNFSQNYEDLCLGISHIIIVNIPSKHYEIINQIKNIQVPILVEKPLFTKINHFKNFSNILTKGLITE